MQILYRFWVGAAGVAAILHNELIVSSHSVFDGLNYNGLLCNIALEGFWLRGLENSSLFFYIKLQIPAILTTPFQFKVST
jgi:hypothetical protein